MSGQVALPGSLKAFDLLLLLECDLLAELAGLLKLPTVGPDGRPMGYRIDSKALGRELQEEETLEQASVPEGDRLMLTADVTAG